MKLLTKEHQKYFENQRICYICHKKFENKYLKDEKCCKVRDHCHFKDSICILKYDQPKKIPIVFHNGSNYDRLSS